MTTRSKKIFLGILFVSAPFFIASVCLGVGRYSLGLAQTISILLSPFTGTDIPPMEASVIWEIRLPRILLAMAAGAALASAGVAFQSLFGNPLATPDTLGVSSGASFGAVLALMFGMNIVGVQIMALVFGLFSVTLTWSFSRTKKGSSIVMLVLSGIVISALFEALISLIKYVADPEQVLPTITYWLMGSLASVNLPNLSIGIPLIAVGVSVILLLRWRLNILEFGEDEAKSLGINLTALRLTVVIASTMVTASCVSMCGKVGWVGLLIPHISRMLRGSNNKDVVPTCISVGAIFVLLVDTFARSATEAEIPISILTAIIGAPFFISLLRKTGGGWSS